MKQNKKEHLEKTENLIKLGETISNEVSPVYDDEEFDDRISLSDNVTEEIKQKRKKIRDIDEKKESVILQIIGQLYNGVLIKEGLSFRRGKVYEYRRQYPASVSTIKEMVMKNLHEVSTKIKGNNLDVLEFMLQKYYTNPNSHIISRNRNYWGNKDGEKRQKIIKFPEFKIVERRNKEIAEKQFSIFTLNGLIIDDDGKVQFFYEYKDEKGELKTEFPDLDSETFAGLYIKFEKEIEDNAKVFIDELNGEIENAEKEMKEITDKGQNQLALAELMKQDNKNIGDNLN